MGIAVLGFLQLPHSLPSCGLGLQLADQDMVGFRASFRGQVWVEEDGGEGEKLNG